jgi:hypothetical protein
MRASARAESDDGAREAGDRPAEVASSFAFVILGGRALIRADHSALSDGFQV